MPKELEEAVQMYRDSRTPGYQGLPVRIQFVDYLISFSGVLSSIISPYLYTRLSIREVTKRFPKIGYTMLQERLSGRVQG